MLVCVHGQHKTCVKTFTSLHHPPPLPPAKIFETQSILSTSPNLGFTPQHTYFRCCSWVGIDTTEVVETDHDQEIVAVEYIEGEHDRVLSVPEVGYDVDIHGTDHHRDANEHQEETELGKAVRMCVRM